MGTQDISRNLFDRRKHYASVRMQQGRVSTDDDWNENNRIHEELNRLSLLDVVGPAATPDDGFRIADPQAGAPGIDFRIKAGRFYLGGMPLMLEQDQTFRRQNDWLQGPDAVARPQGPRTDLVYLEACTQVVSAVEDSELYEVALGGADTGTRLRVLQRVRVMVGIGSDECLQAWQQRIGTWGNGTLQPDYQLQSDATLSVDFEDMDGAGSLCEPDVAGGFLGAENQVIRVQLQENRTFTWGFDNAAPLYRVTLSADRRTLTLITPPKDQYHWPRAEQTVEVLAWAAILPNQEKTAEHQGFLSRVAVGYDPVEGTITLAESVPQTDFDNWRQRSDAQSLHAGPPYYFMRVWRRGADRTSANAIAFVPGDPVALGHTGLQLTFHGTQFVPGDYWLITARPAAPHEVVPWSLNVSPGGRALGRKRYYAPLALLHWSGDQSVTVSDCRYSFKPLGARRCCVDLVARPGNGWYHIFEQIPPHGDAVICLPPGRYPLARTVSIRNKGRIVLTGAGKASRIQGTACGTLLAFESCDQVDLRDLYLFGGNPHDNGIAGTLAFADVAQVDLHKVAVRCKGGTHRDMTCLRVDNDFISRSNTSGRVRVSDCDFYVGHLQTGILIVNADHIEILDNRLVPSGPDVAPMARRLRDAQFRFNLAQTAIIPAPEGLKGVPRNQRVLVSIGEEQILFRTDPLLKPFWDNCIKALRNLENYSASTSGLLRIRLKNHLERILRSPDRRNRERDVARWLAELEKTPAFMGQGIVVGGRRAHWVGIRNNDIGYSWQGIHVGLSRSTTDRSEASAETAGDLFVRNNRIRTLAGPGAPRERHGCFVGNVENLTVNENSLQLERPGGMRHLPVDAIRIFGFLGDAVRIYDNRAKYYSQTVRISGRGRISEDDLRVERDNVP